MKVADHHLRKLFIGIDIHKRSWKVHTATELFDGKTLTVPPSPEALKKYIDHHFPDYEVSCVYEAGCCGYHAHRSFLAFGWNSLVVNPADVSRTGKSQYQKTDKIDAKLLCRELKDGRLTGIHIPDPEREQLRSLFRRRNDLVKSFRQVKTQMKSQLLYLGVELPEEFDNSNWSKKFLGWISSQRFEHATADMMFRSRLEHYAFLDQNLRDVSNALRRYCRRHYKKDYYLLKSIPGIGGIVACGIISELGDLRRFKNFKQLAAYVGLIPGIRQSGDNSRSTGINPRGNRIMRSYFVEASWQALRFDPVLQEYYRSHAGKDSKAILVKVARKLLSRTYAVIRTEIPYQAGVVQ